LALRGSAGGCKEPPLPWDGAAGADARLSALVPWLVRRKEDWPMISTHVPGWSADECRRRWDWLRTLQDAAA
jgi:hypothetical protein